MRPTVRFDPPIGRFKCVAYAARRWSSSCLRRPVPVRRTRRAADARCGPRQKAGYLSVEGGPSVGPAPAGACRRTEKTGELVAEAAKRAPPVERALEASGQRGVGHGGDELRHVPPPGTHSQRCSSSRLFVVLVIVVGRLAVRRSIRPPPWTGSPSRIDARSSGPKRAGVARVPLECVREHRAPSAVFGPCRRRAVEQWTRQSDLRLEHRGQAGNGGFTQRL